MKAGTANDQNEMAPTKAKQRHKNISNEPGNTKVNQLDTHRLLAHSHQTWIDSKGDTVFDNPIKTVHTMMNWYYATVTNDKVDTIPNIKELDRPKPLIESVWVFSKKKDIILTRRSKPLKKLLSCKNPEENPILIVVVATRHAYEKDNNKLPYYLQCTVLMLLIQDEPHFILPASTTNKNLDLGKMIRNKDLQKTSFEVYMQNNVN